MQRISIDAFWLVRVSKVCGLSLLASLLAITLATGVPARADGKHFVIQGSSSVSLTVRRLLGEFAVHDNVRRTEYCCADSDYVVSGLMQHQCDVGLVLDSLVPDVNKELGESFEAFPLGQLAVGVAVNARKRIRSIGTDRLGNIYHGEITTWIGRGPDSLVPRIKLYSPLLGMTRSYIFQRNVMGGKEFAPELRDRSTETWQQKDSVDGIIGAVIKNLSAIGFFLLEPDMIIDKRVRLLAIAKGEEGEAVLPTLETIAEGTYPITDQLTFYLHPDAPPIAREFVKFATGPKGAAIVRGYGLWPERELEKHRSKVRLKEMEAGKGVPLTVRGVEGAAKVMGAVAVDFVRAKTTIQFDYRPAALGTVEKVLGEGVKLFVSDRPLPQSQTDDAEPDRVESKQLASRAVAVVVHPGNGIEELTVVELRDIFAGKITNWPEEKRRIQLFGLRQKHDLAKLFETKVVGPTREARIKRRADTAKVIEAVAASPEGIGFINVAEIGPNEDRVKVVGLFPPGKKHPLVPSSEQVPPGYPLAQPLMLYLSPDADETAQDFFDFLATGGGHDTIREHGFIPSRPSPRRSRKSPVDPTTASATDTNGEETTPNPSSGPTTDTVAQADSIKLQAHTAKDL